jgi:hypothetical protein
MHESLKGVFGLELNVEVRCPCSKTTRQEEDTWYFECVEAKQLWQLLTRRQPGGLASLLRQVAAQRVCTCDVDVGGCGADSSLTRMLVCVPRVFTLRVRCGAAVDSWLH